VTVLKAMDLSASIGRTKILDEVSVNFGAGELVGLIGPNGAGKTTLLKCLLGLLKPDSGTISLDGRALPAWSRSEVAKRLGYLAQGAPCHWPMTAERIVELGRLPHAGSGRELNSQTLPSVSAALEKTGTMHLRSRVVTSLSGGERTLVMIARCLAGGAPLLLADEPVTGLDPRHQIEIMQTLRAQAAGPGGVVAVLHDLNLAARFCTQLVLMHQGRIVSEGAPDQVLTSEHLANVYGIDAALRRVDGQMVVLHQGSRG
jgi:iron complex transport system ATP-binding protein